MSTVETYREISITTESRGRLVVLLYDGAIKFLRRAQEAIRIGDYTLKGRCLNQARDIIVELNQSLNLEAGGELAKNLRSLYSFLWKYVGEASIKNDIQMLEKAIGILDDLGGAWRKIAS